MIDFKEKYKKYITKPLIQDYRKGDLYKKFARTDADRKKTARLNKNYKPERES